MAVKELAFDVEARMKMLQGVEKLALAVKSTLGPRGRNAVSYTHLTLPTKA